jgi:hypothetical protein
MFISRKAVIAGVSTLVLVGGGAALAYFTSQGVGQGTATVADVPDTDVITLAFDGAAISPLYPGGQARTTPITAQHAGSGSLTVENVVLGAVSNNKPGCDMDWFEVQVTSDGRVAVAPGSPVPVGTLSVRLKESGTNQDACQGAALNISVNTAGPAPTATPSPSTAS